jgi:hypothetical protein
MTRCGRNAPPPGSPDHEHPAIDEAGLVAARHADRLLAAAREIGADRWIAYFERSRIASATTTRPRCAQPRRAAGRVWRQGFDPRRASESLTEPSSIRSTA